MVHWDKLTPAERRAYVDQDKVLCRELLSDTLDQSNLGSPWVMDRVERPCLNNTVYYLYFVDRMPVKTIAYHVPLSARHIYRIVNRIHEYLLAHNAAALSKFLNMPYNTAWEIVQRLT